MMENIRLAQKNMNEAYSGGFAGVIVSGIVWFITGVTTFFLPVENVVWVLFFGGMFIHPSGILLDKILGTSGVHDKENPLGKLAMEGTIWMIICLPIALMLTFQNPVWFFQAMLLIIGGRYLTFQTLYGNKVFWLLGLILVFAGFSLFFLKAQANVSIFTGALIEIVLGTYCLINFRKTLIH